MATLNNKCHFGASCDSYENYSKGYCKIDEVYAGNSAGYQRGDDKFNIFMTTENQWPFCSVEIEVKELESSQRNKSISSTTTISKMVFICIILLLIYNKRQLLL